MTIKDKKTTAGGNRGYKMVRSKNVKGPDGYGKVITKARENMISKGGGKDPGYNVTANHTTGGAHHEEDGGKFRKGTRAENTAESNRARAKKNSRAKRLCNGS